MKTAKQLLHELLNSPISKSIEQRRIFFRSIFLQMSELRGKEQTRLYELLFAGMSKDEARRLLVPAFKQLLKMQQPPLH